MIGLSEKVSESAAEKVENVSDTPVSQSNQAKISSFFAKRPMKKDEIDLMKRVKVVPPEAVPSVLPLRAPSPVSVSPEELKQIEERKLEALQRMEAKRLARVCSLEFEELPSDWLGVLEDELAKPYFVRLKEFLQREWDNNVKIFPPQNMIYTWAKCCPLEKVMKSRSKSGY